MDCSQCRSFCRSSGGKGPEPPSEKASVSHSGEELDRLFSVIPPQGLALFQWASTWMTEQVFLKPPSGHCICSGT